jgi:ornithine cyclodeaminase
MLILSKADMTKVFTMHDAIEASKIALSLYADKKSVVPLRVNIDIAKEDAVSLFMPAYVSELDSIGIKTVTVFPKNSDAGLPTIAAKMLLMNGKTGEFSALLDATYLTQLRTGALQGAAIDILARTDAKIAVLFGTGGQAMMQLEAMLTVRELEKVFVIGTNFQRTLAFVAKMQKEFSRFETEIIAVEQGNEVIALADIITVATTSITPVFDGTLVKKGAHINGIGAYTPVMQELPETIIQLADKIFFDTSEGVLAEAGDIIIPLNNGSVKVEDFHGDLGQVILGAVKGRDIIFIKNR